MNEDLREPIPRNSVWTLEDLAKYLNTQPGPLMEKLKENGVKVLDLGARSKLKLIRIEDLVPK